MEYIYDLPTVNCCLERPALRFTPSIGGKKFMFATEKTKFTLIAEIQGKYPAVDVSRYVCRLSFKEQ